MEKNDPNQKFGLPADQLAKLAGLKKTPPEKKTEKIKVEEKRAEEKLSPEEEENKRIFELEEKIEKAEKEGDEKKIKELRNLLDEKMLEDAIKNAGKSGEELILEDVAAQFGKTVEELNKIIDKLGFEEKKESAKPEIKKEKEVKRPQGGKIPAKETAPKPEYSEKYLRNVLRKSQGEGDKKLEAYYQAELDKYYKKTAEPPLRQDFAARGPVIKTERQTGEIKKSEAVPEKNMPKFEQFGPPAPAKKTEEKPVESSVEKPAYDPLEIGEVYAEKPGKGESEKITSAAEKSAEDVKLMTYEEQITQKSGEEKSEKPAEEEKEKTELEIVREKFWEIQKKEEAEKEFERRKEILFKQDLTFEEMEEQLKIQKKMSEKFADEVIEKAKAAMGAESKEEEIPLGAEAAVRPMGGEKKKPLVERTEEEKKERAEEMKKFKEMKKARVEYAEKAKDYYKYQTILGKFKKVFGGKEEAAKVTEEFEAARIKYEKAQAEFNGEKLIRHNVEERRRVNEIIGVRAKENSTFEKFRAAYKWLGDQNLEKVIRPQSKIGKIICRTASLRTAVGLGLGLTGFGLALSGGTAMAVGSALFLRKLYSGAASGLGTYEGLRMLAEKKTAINDEEIKNLDLKSANEKMAQIESWAILNGKKIMEYPDYVKIRDKRTELLAGEKSGKLSETMAGQFGRMNAEINKRNRGEMYRKAAALGMGVFVGSGAMASLFRKGLHGLGIIGETPTPGARPEIIPKGTDIIKESYIETAGKGSSVWKMVDHQLQSRFGERFNGLNAAQKTYLIDYYKDIVAKNPKAFGLEDIDVVKPGQKINFAPLFTDTANFEKGIGKALKLTFAETQNILSNNKILREWVLSHPGERLTSARVEELLRMPKGTMAEHFANDNMIVKPSGVTVDEIIAEQEKIRTAEIVGGMEERAVARILNNTIQESGLTWEEYRAIKAVSVKQLLEQAHWDNWKAGTVDLPHDGIYGGTEFARQVKLAEAIRSLNPSGGQLDMSVEDYLKGAIKEGKFSSRGAIEVPAGQAVLEGSPAEIEARPRGVAAGVEAAAESKPKVIEAAETKGERVVAAAAETKAAPKFERMVNFVYDADGKVTGMASEIKPEDAVRAKGLMNDNWSETVRNNPAFRNKSLAMSAIENRGRTIASYQRALEGLESAGKGNTLEADYLRKFIAKTVENTEKQYGDVFK